MIYKALGVMFLAILAGILYGFYQWESAIEDKVAAENTTASAQKTIEQKVEVAKVEEKVLVQYQEVKTEIKYVDREVTKEVIKYRDRVVDRCVLNAEWVRIYNASLQPVRNAESPTRVASQP